MMTPARQPPGTPGKKPPGVPTRSANANSRQPPGTPGKKPPGVPTCGADARSARPCRSAPARGTPATGVAGYATSSAFTYPATPSAYAPHTSAPLIQRLITFTVPVYLNKPRHYFVYLRSAPMASGGRVSMACYLFAPPHNATLCNHAEKSVSYIMGVMRQVFLSCRLQNTQATRQKNALTFYRPLLYQRRANYPLSLIHI